MCVYCKYMIILLWGKDPNFWTTLWEAFNKNDHYCMKIALFYHNILHLTVSLCSLYNTKLAKWIGLQVKVLYKTSINVSYLQDLYKNNEYNFTILIKKQQTYITLLSVLYIYLKFTCTLPYPCCSINLLNLHWIKLIYSEIPSINKCFSLYFN